MLTLNHSCQLRARMFATCRKYLATQSQVKIAPTGNSISAVTSDANEEYSEVPEYPEIRDLSFHGRKLQKTRDWHEEIRSVPTIEEKMIKINMPRYYGFKVVDLNDTLVPYNALPMTQHYTRTVFEQLQPEKSQIKVDAENKQMDAFLKATRSNVIEAIEHAHDYYNNTHPKTNVDDNNIWSANASQRESEITQIIVEQLNRSLLQTLAADHQHLNEVEIDYSPRHEAFWAVGGIKPTKQVVKSKKGHSWQKEYANEPVDRLVQYTGMPYLALRHRLQLPAWQPLALEQEQQNQEANLAKQLPRYDLDARTLGYTTKYQHAVNVPGYWPGSPNGFGFISYQSRAHLCERPWTYDEADVQETLHVQGIQSSFAWLLAQANYNGFNTYNELTYPLNTQTIITNGRDWSFYEYQLNTLLTHGNHVDTNPKVNYCRGTPVLRLYEEISPEGKCVGLNDDVLLHLIRFYTNAPNIQRTKEELQPYVAIDTGLQRSCDYENPEQRIFLENVFKHLSSKRPRHLELPEIYLWEKIYKIDHKTRPMEAKRRFFEVDVNPWRRTLDQHDKVYIPRKVRPGGPKSRDRFEKTYYP